MTSFTVARDIAAPPARVWAVLTDTATLTSPAFGITELTGDMRAKGRLRLRSEVDPKRQFSLRVTGFEPERRMVWTGGMPFGLFKGERVFTLTPQDGGCRFTMTETFTGLMSGLITKHMPDLQPSFDKFGDALKRKAET